MLGSRNTRSIDVPLHLSSTVKHASSVGRLLAEFRRTVGVDVGSQTLSALEPRPLQVIGCG